LLMVLLLLVAVVVAAVFALKAGGVTVAFGDVLWVQVVVKEASHHPAKNPKGCLQR